MTVAFLVGRIIVGLYFLNSAYAHLFKAHHMVGYAEAKGVKPATPAIVFSGILLLLGGLSILLGVYAYVGIVLLVLFLLGVSFKMHAYWNEADPMAKMGDRVNFMKNMALVGFLLMLYAIPDIAWMYPFNW
jgi:uncharacterized membrane protein YphA (DoxX/SURF4 family)